MRYTMKTVALLSVAPQNWFTGWLLAPAILLSAVYLGAQGRIAVAALYVGLACLVALLPVALQVDARRRADAALDQFTRDALIRNGLD